MRGTTLTRKLALLIAALALAVFVVGCGDDNEDGSKTSEGAAAGATGDAAGGFAVEAGKKRDEKDVEQEEAYSPEPPPVQLQTGDRSDLNVDEPTLEIARSNAELAKLRKQLGLKRSEVAAVDFGTRQVVVVQMPSEARGTLMQIQDISVRNGVITARVARVLPGEGCARPDYKPNPFNMVETRKMTETKTKILVEDVNNGACR